MSLGSVKLGRGWRRGFRAGTNGHVALVDVHAHLTHPELASDEGAVLERARAAGLGAILANGLNPRDNQAVYELAARDPLVRPAFGFYPVDVVLPEMRALGVEYPREGEECSAAQGVQWVREHVAGAVTLQLCPDHLYSAP